MQQEIKSVVDHGFRALGADIRGNRLGPSEELYRVVDEVRALPKQVKKAMLTKFQLMLETAVEVQDIRDKRPAYVRENPEWHMLTSRN